MFVTGQGHAAADMVRQRHACRYKNMGFIG